MYSYAVLKHLLSEQNAAYLTSSFWGFLTLGRGLAIPVLVVLLSSYKCLDLVLYESWKISSD